MGLDVYLYRYDAPAEEIAEREAQAEKFSDETWKRVGGGKDYSALTDAQKDEARVAVKEYNAANGFSEYGQDVRKVEIQKDSVRDPEHLFKLGYFRSSYNDGGINRISENTTGITLYTVFGVDDEYEVRPDWTMARVRCVEWIEKLKAAPRLRCSTIHTTNMFTAPPTADDANAVQMAAEELKQTHFGGDGWSSQKGHFYPKGLKIVAAIPGIDVFKEPAVHLVYEDEGFDWYITAAEIVLETIDFVLAQPNPEAYVLHWSS